MYKLEQEYHHLSLWYFVSFIFGIIFFFRVELNYSFFSIIFCIVLFTSAALVLRSRSLLLLFASYLLLSFFIGIFVSHLRMSNIQTNPISKPMFSEISGRVDTIKPGLRGTQITLKDVTLADSTYLNKIRVNVSNKLISNVSYGDVINLRAKLFPLQGSVLPGTYDFGFYMYMSGIEASGYALTGIEVTEKNKSFVDQYIQTIRQKIYKQLINVLGANNGNFASAILIGETKAIPLKIADDMRNSGVAHVLSVSGLHLSLVAMIFFITSRMILNCSNYIAYNYNIKIIAAIISVIGSFLYLQISGANIAATRAFIMTSIFIASIILGRSPYPLRSVMIAAVLILAFLPEYIFHPSFQLSFTAVLCLIGGYEFYMKNKNILGNSKGVFATIKLYIFANIYSSFLAGFVTAPYVIFHFYKFANYSVLMNLIAVPLMSFFMMPLVIIATILMPMGLDQWPLKLLGFFITIVVESAAYIVSLPGSIWITGRISELSLLVFTFGFFWLCLWKTSWRLIGIIIMLISIGVMFLDKKPDFIYDHNLKIVGIKNDKNQLELYSQNKLSNFTSNYWANWYGQDSVNVINQKISAEDHIFTLKSGKTISLNYWKCLDADVQIITSKKLHCSGDAQIIQNEDIWKHKQILLYCDSPLSCKIEYKE